MGVKRDSIELSQVVLARKKAAGLLWFTYHREIMAVACIFMWPSGHMVSLGERCSSYAVPEKKHV